MLSFIKPSPIILTFITASGVLMHDMHIDRAATVAVTLPAIVASAGVDKFISGADHTHSERASIPRGSSIFNSTLPKVDPPRADGRSYVKDKKLSYSGGGDAVSLWPSV